MKEERVIPKYDLEERTARFGEKVIDFVKVLPVTTLNRPIVVQLIRSASSIGANYMEACGAESKKDFIHKISICKKEATETKHWLRMLARLENSKMHKLKVLWREAQELTLIFSKIIQTSKVKNKN